MPKLDHWGTNEEMAHLIIGHLTPNSVISAIASMAIYITELTDEIAKPHVLGDTANLEDKITKLLRTIRTMEWLTRTYDVV